MNIFYLDETPKIASKYLDDVRVIKMIVESGQMLSTAHRVLDGEEIKETINNRKQSLWRLPDEREGFLYKATHVNHPSSKWVRESSQNYSWLLSYTLDLLYEYIYRFGKNHKTNNLVPYIVKMPNNIEYKSFTHPPLAMPDQYKESDVVKSYRNYFLSEKMFPKNKPAKWTNREVPYWIK